MIPFGPVIQTLVGLSGRFLTTYLAKGAVTVLRKEITKNICREIISESTNVFLDKDHNNESKKNKTSLWKNSLR